MSRDQVLAFRSPCEQWLCCAAADECAWPSRGSEIGDALRKQSGAMQSLLLTSDEAEKLRHVIGVAWSEGEIEEAEATALYAAVTRVTRP